MALPGRAAASTSWLLSTTSGGTDSSVTAGAGAGCAGPAGCWATVCVAGAWATTAGAVEEEGVAGAPGPGPNARGGAPGGAGGGSLGDNRRSSRGRGCGGAARSGHKRRGGLRVRFGVQDGVGEGHTGEECYRNQREEKTLHGLTSGAEVCLTSVCSGPGRLAIEGGFPEGGKEVKRAGRSFSLGGRIPAAPRN